MYYNSDQNSNDYYSAYKEEMGNTRKSQERSGTNQILKLGLIILFLGLLVLSAFYFFNLKESTSVATPSKIAQIALPKSIQQQESNTKTKQNSNEGYIKETISSVTGSSSINPKDIELIVKIIMSQMNQTAQKEMTTNTSPSLEEQLLNAEEKVMPKQTLKESNHYNKVLIASNKPITDTSNELMLLQNSLNDVLEESSEKSGNSDYSKAISKEVDVRSNEMRIIMVKKGDTLSKIAKKAYGNYDDYVKIFNANPEVVKHPDEIFVGQKLRIPS